MMIGSLSENKNYESRIAVTPDLIKKYNSLGLEINLVKGYGEHLGFTDSLFEDSGAKIHEDENNLLKNSEIIVQCGLPSKEKTSLLKENQTLIGVFNPYENQGDLN